MCGRPCGHLVSEMAFEFRPPDPSGSGTTAQEGEPKPRGVDEGPPSPSLIPIAWPLPYRLSGEEHTCQAAINPGSTPGSGRSPGEGKGNPLQYSCLENPRDSGAWQAAVHGVSRSQIPLGDQRATTALFHAWCEVRTQSKRSMWGSGRHKPPTGRWQEATVCRDGCGIHSWAAGEGRGAGRASKENQQVLPMTCTYRDQCPRCPETASSVSGSQPVTANHPLESGHTH